jgi:hypothetical protein
MGLVSLLVGSAAFGDETKVEIGGRVFVRETVSAQDGGDWLGLATLESARLEIDLERGPFRGKLELDAGGGSAKVRDAFVRVGLGGRVELRAGRFKRPFSVLELESPWSIATVGRGLLSDALGEGLGVTGRTTAVQLGWRGKGDVEPFVQGGVYQARTLAGDPQAAPLGDGLGLDTALRGGVRLDLGAGDLELGAQAMVRTLYDSRPGKAALAPFWAAGLDVGWDGETGFGGVRVWIEGLSGSSPVDATPMTTDDPTFAAGRGEIAVRFGGDKRGARYVEPFALGSILDPNLDAKDDLVGEVLLGLNVGAWRRWRVQMQGEIRRVQGAVPVGLGGPGGAFTDLDAVRVQLGVAF